MAKLAAGCLQAEAQADRAAVADQVLVALHRRIRIGNLSGNFRVHPKVFLMAGLFRDHDRTRFSIHVYSSSIDDGSHWRNWLRSHCDRFVDISGMPNAEAAGMVAGDQVDVLVDLDGHQAGSRLDVCAFRPASIMVSWIGMPGTTGAEFIDYTIADKVVLPPECNRFFTEEGRLSSQLLPADPRPA